MGQTQDTELDDDPRAAQSPMIATLAGSMVAIASFFSAGAGVQLEVVIGLYGWPRWVAFALVVLGVLGVLAGGLLTRAHLGAAIASVVLSSALAIIGVVWGIFAGLNGLLVPLPILAGFLALFAAMVAPFALGPVRKTHLARQKLYL